MVANSNEDSGSTAQTFANGIFGLLTFGLNFLSLVAVLQSRSFPIRQKVIFISILVTDTIVGIQVTGVRLLPIHYSPDHILCKVRLYAGITIALATSLSNVLITTERFLSIILPMRLNKKITWKVVAVFAIFLWILSITLALSLFSDGFSGPVCEFIVTGNPNGYVFIGCVMWVSFLTILIMYVYIVKITRRHIRQITTTMVGNTPIIDARKAFQSKAELRMTVTVGIIVGMFGVSYSPVACYLIYGGLFVPDLLAFTTSYETVFKTVITFFTMNSVINPIIYILRLRNCRQEMIARILCRPQPRFDNMGISGTSSVG
ncbi:hypothetical protein SNE40_016289 [Patella caerulea]|uniref:G-protein coupled receptors family 1 profile domain-containing protein n=1 Tax=Patella caerulea TaxID=87958 RepID=A0AAN8PCZ5_PATCE